MIEEKTLDGRLVFPRFSVLIFSFGINFDNVILIPILAHIVISMGGDYIMAGFVVGVYSIVHLFTNILSGFLIDKIGRKNIITLGLVLDTIAMLLYYLSSSIPLLILTRIIHGLGGGFAGPATMTYLSDISRREKVSRSMSMYGIFFGLSYLIGFTYSGIMSYYYGYGALFASTAIFLLILSVASVFLPNIYSTSIIKEKALSVPLRDIALKPPILASYLTSISIYFNLGVVTAVLTDVLYQIGMDHREVAAVLSTFIIVSIAIQYPVGKFVDKGYGEYILIGSLALTAIAFYISFMSLTTTTAYIVSAVFGLAHGLSFPSSTGLISRNTEPYYRGRAKGILFATIILGAALGSNLGGLIAEKLSPTILWMVSSLQAVLTGVIVAYISLLRK